MIPTSLLTRSRDKGTWGVCKAYRPALRVHAKLIKRDVHITESSRIISPRPHAPRPASLWLPKPETFANLAKHPAYWAGLVSENMTRVFRPQSRKARIMKPRRPINYLRSYRLRWGLSQVELATLLGWDRPEVISRIEKKQRPPSLRLAIACFILFGTQVDELFPDIFTAIDATVMSRVQEMYETVQGDPSRKTKKKIDLFENAIERAEHRKRASQLV